MGLSYFGGKSWSEITREERVFCAELERHMCEDPDRFVRLLQEKANLPADLSGPWDTAFEACFYRDYFHKFDPSRKKDYSSKRTFDLALFSETAVIIIEAKAAETFSVKQTKHFKKDVSALTEILEPVERVFLVALAAKTYFNNYAAIGRGTALEPFENRHLTWEDVADHYPGAPLLERASQVYERSPMAIVSAEEEPHWSGNQYNESLIQRARVEIEQRERAIAEMERESES